MKKKSATKEKINQCSQCNGKCCKYLAIEIDKPRSKNDFDDIRWYLAHKDVTVFIDEKKWYINFATRCTYLMRNNKCRMYGNRPRICKEHRIEHCEYDGDYDFDEMFETVQDIEQYYQKIVDKRKRNKSKRKKARL